MFAQLPKPPSVNHLYGMTCRGRFPHRYITNEGRAWFEGAGLQLKLASKGEHFPEGSLALHVQLFTSRAQDVDNILKVLLDLFQKQGIIENDSQIHFLTVRKHKCVKIQEKVEIVLEKYNQV